MEDHSHSAPVSKLKPLLFAAGGIGADGGGGMHKSSLFPSANAPGPSSTYTESNDKTSDLESLKLNIAPSTLDAIFAVQSSSHEKPAPHSHSDKSDESFDEQLTSHPRLATKRSLHHSPERYEDESTDDEPRKNKRKGRKQKKAKKKKKGRSRKRSPSPARPPIDFTKIGRNKVFLDDIPNLLPEDAFKLDRASNKELLHYESVAKSQIAKYSLFHNSCLGNSNISLGHDKESSKKKRKWKFQSPRYFAKSHYKQSRVKGFSCISHPADFKHFSSEDFITLSRARENENHSNSLGTYSCLDEATSLYAQGKGMQEDETRADKDDFVMDEVFEKVAKLNRLTREDPTNVGQWLKFVNFQDELARIDKGFSYSALNLRDVFQPPRSVVEKKIAILDKALELNPSSLELKKVQLELYQDIWESDKVEKAWEDLLFVHASDIDLWSHYLLRQQTRLSTFTFSSVVKKYHRCFNTLIPILEGRVKVVKKSEDLEEKLIGLFCQYCTFLHQCGYTERAVNSFQALIEFNLFCPPSLNLKASDERKEKFEAFWESTAPKFGDAKAKGWAKWEDRKESLSTEPSSSLDSTDALEDSILKEELPRFRTWLKMENVRQEAHYFPWKPDENKGEQEDDCEDPDRLVLFDDIRPSLFILTKSDNCVKAVCLFLSFMGLTNHLISRVFHELEESVFAQHHFDKMHQISELSSLSCGLDVGMRWTPHICLVAFIRRILEQAEAYFSSSTRALFTLLRLELELKKTGALHAHELSKSNSKEIKKFGKSLLKESQNRNNLIVWDSFIRLSWAVSEKMEETASMVDIALGMFLDSSALLDPQKSLGVLLLCRTFSQIMLNFEPLEHIKMKGRRSCPNSNDKLQVMGCLGALADGSKFKPHGKVDMSPARVLKTRKRFDALIQQYISDSSSVTPAYIYSKLVALTECSALFEYCASNFQSANDVFTNVENLVKKEVAYRLETNCEKNINSLLLKDLYISHVSFILNVMGIDNVSLAHLRTVLDKALIEFPNEFHFYYIFIEIESGSYIAGRLRKFYEKHLKRCGNISLTLFAVLSEVMRFHFVRKALDVDGVMQTGISDSGVVNRIRTLFEHCLHPQVGGHCPLLWRLALSFEASNGDKDKAKGILYRALQNCPWSKSIYLDGVDLFGDLELQEMSDLMTEKEIRVRIPLEEVDLLLTAEKQSDDDVDDDNDCDMKDEENEIE